MRRSAILRLSSGRGRLAALASGIALAALPLTGCGIAGEEGAAKFTVGDYWQPAVPIAVGSHFAVSAKSTQLGSTAALTVSSSDPAVFASEAGGFVAASAGKAWFVAKKADDTQVDQLQYEAAAVKTAQLGYWAERLVEPGALLPATFALVRGSKPTLRAFLQASDGRGLNHRELASLTPATPSVLTTAGDGSADFTVSAIAQGSSALTAAAGTISKEYQVLTAETADIASIEIGYVPITLDVSKVDRNQPSQPPETSDDPEAPAAYFAMARAKLADGTSVYGTPAQWSVTEGSVELVQFSGGASEVQYFTLKPGQTAKLKAVVGSASAEIAVEY